MPIMPLGRRAAEVTAMSGISMDRQQFLGITLDQNITGCHTSIILARKLHKPLHNETNQITDQQENIKNCLFFIISIPLEISVKSGAEHQQ